MGWHGIALSCTSTKFLWKLALAQGRRFCARCQCSIVGWPCHPPPPAQICLIHGKHPIPWGRGRHFHPLLGCNSPLVSHQYADELGHDHHSGKGWNWTHQQISHEISDDGSSSGAWEPMHGVGGNDHESVWGICLDVLSDTQLAIKRLWTVRAETRRPVSLISPNLILDDETNSFLLCIQIRARYSLGVVILNRCPCSLWIALPEHNGGLLRCHLVTLLCSLISPYETAHGQPTEQWVQEFQVGYWLAWLSLCFEIEIA